MPHGRRPSNVPTLVLWGESDRIADPDYGRAFAAAIPEARFELLPSTGHVPQIETPDLLALHLWNWLEQHTTASVTSGSGSGSGSGV